MSVSLDAFKWFKDGFKDYNPIPETLKNIRYELENHSIDIIIDVDCMDVQALIPRLIKTLYLSDIKNYKIHQIDMKKLPLKIIDNQNLIEKVPTIIFKKNDREQFRITERLFNCSRIEKEIEYLLVTMIARR